MGRITKKSVNALMDIYNKNVVDPFVLALQNPQDNNATVMEINVKTRLTLDEKGQFIDRVVNFCFDGNGDYMPQYLDAVFSITLLQMTTNVSVFESTVTGDNNEEYGVVDIERTYELCKAINLEKAVQDETYQDLIKELRSMIADKLAYRKQMQFSREREILNKAREEVENGVAMIVAVADKLNETLASASSANDMAAALQNMNYAEMVNAVLAQA